MQSFTKTVLYTDTDGRARRQVGDEPLVTLFLKD